MILLILFILGWLKMKIDNNECWYQGNHDACTHSYYCIFNSNRCMLESMIADLERQLWDIQFQLSNYGEIYTDKTFDELRKDKILIRNDLEDLYNFRENIIDKEVVEYGYGLLES